MSTNYRKVFSRKREPKPRELTPACEHLSEVTELVEPATRECATCLAQGDRWVHLRMCVACGNVACCDSSVNKHARAHFDAMGHPVMRGIEPGERWVYCYLDSETAQR